MDYMAILTALKPWLAQSTRDGLRFVGMFLLSKGILLNDAGVVTFIGAGMSLAGLVWGWLTTGGAEKIAGLLKKVTGTMTHADAVKAAQVLPPAAAVDTALKATAVRAVTNILLVAFVLSAFLAAPAMAQGKLKLPIDPLGLNDKPTLGQKLTGSAVTDIQGFMNAKFLPDLQYALKLAQASKNNITSDCYQAWIDIITTQQTAVQTKNPDGTTTDLPMPDPHVITEFEKLVELRNALQPESPFMVKCSPVASMIKKDIASFMGIVLTGGAGLATLVPGL